jgi:hypothetical protein
MRNITISLQDHILKAGRDYAKQHELSLNGLIRDLLAKTVLKPSGDARLEQSFRLAARAKGDSHGKKWTRDELYDV